MAANNNIPAGGGSPVPTAYDCEVPVDYVYDDEDTDTWINKFEVQCVECPPLPFPTSSDLWNCSLCGNDERYEHPVIDGDEFYIQYKANLAEFKFYWGFLFDKDNNIIETPDGPGLFGFTTTDDLGNNFNNIKINVSNIPSSCFYIKIYALRCDVDLEAVTECTDIAIGLGAGPNEAFRDCLLEDCEDYEEYYTDLYRKTNSECEETVLIATDYHGKHDCSGRYYGDDGSGNRFSLWVRVPGELVQTDYDIEATTVNSKRRTSKLKSTYSLRTHKIPPQTAAVIADILAGGRFFVDGVQYYDATKLSKNNEDGRMWILNVTMTKDCDEIDFACEN